jgi:hypothetical protein
MSHILIILWITLVSGGTINYMIKMISLSAWCLACTIGDIITMIEKIGFGGLIIVLLICALIGGFCWPYTLNSWLVFFGKVPSIQFWQGMVLGFIPFIGQATIPAAVITWILMMFLV